MKKRYCDFQSFLSQHFKDFIQYKRSLGNKYATEETALYLFDSFIYKENIQDIREINSDLLSKFLCLRPRFRPHSYNHLRGVVHRFIKWLKLQGVYNTALPFIPKRRVTSQRIPFIFDDAQAERLLAKTASLPDNSRAFYRAEIYSLIFTLLYNLGLRVGEVSRLYIKDIDMERKLLVIRHTKFNKNRYVPFGPKVAERLTTYLSWRRNQIVSLESPVFTFDGSKAINPGTISLTFHHLVPKLQLNIPPGVSQPRLHDLRHSFAVNTLIKWYQSGIHPKDKLIHLSTFLGHVDPMTTAVYLQITQNLLHIANNRFEQYTASIL